MKEVLELFGARRGYVSPALVRERQKEGIGRKKDQQIDISNLRESIGPLVIKKRKEGKSPNTKQTATEEREGAGYDSKMKESLSNQRKKYIENMMRRSSTR